MVSGLGEEPQARNFRSTKWVPDVYWGGVRMQKQNRLGIIKDSGDVTILGFDLFSFN